MDFIAFTIFLAISVFFGIILAVIVKFLLVRFLPFLMPVPFWFWVLLIVIGMFALQGFGIDMKAAYAGMLRWLAKFLNGVIA